MHDMKCIVNMSAQSPVDNLCEYLRIPSAQPNVNYDDCIKFLRRQASEMGLPVQVFELVPKKPIFVMTWAGEDPHLPSILLNSHMDVVPINESEWKYPPFAGHVSDGVVYGRGVQDMKAHTVQCIEAIRRLRKKNIKMKRTVHLCCVPDEEIGGADGMGKFVKSEAFKSLNVGFCIDEGTPTSNDNLAVYNGGRSGWNVYITCKGLAGHGSLMYPGTSGEKVRYIIDKFMDLRKESMDQLATKWKGNLMNLAEVLSVNLTMLTGGVEINVIPDTIVAGFDLRLPPELDFVQFENQIKQWCEESGKDVTYEFKQKSPKCPPISLDDENVYWTAMKSAFKELKMNYLVGTFPAGMDSRYLRYEDIPALCFSAMRNTPVMAHAANECLQVSVFLEGITIFEEVIRALGNA